MTIKEFFSKEYAIFGIHVLLVTGVMLNIFQFYRQYTIRQQFSKEQGYISVLLQEKRDTEQRKGYISSDLYKEKFAKESNYKTKGEQVIDTSNIEENTSSEPSEYKPTEQTTNKKNWEKWWEIFFLPEPIEKS
jgi:hypothetical protein